MTNAERAREWVKDHGPHIIGGGRFAPRHIDSLTAMLDTVEREAMERAAGIAADHMIRKLKAAQTAASHARDLVASHRQSDAETAESVAAAIRALGGSPLQEKHDTGETT